MKTPSTARAFLLGVATTGREFKHNEVLPDDPTKTDLVLGRGHDFTRTVEVADPWSVARLSGQASLRLIKLEKPDGNLDLFLRTRLSWAVGEVGTAGVQFVRSAGDYEGEYSSWAKYVINDKGAVRLDEQLYTGTNDDWHRSRSYYDAEWQQYYPGALFQAMGVAHDQAVYHRETVQATQREHPGLLDMLSSTERGIVGPKELVNIAAWVSQNMHNQQG